jgi:hypothetical protein
VLPLLLRLIMFFAPDYDEDLCLVKGLVIIWSASAAAA